MPSCQQDSSQPELQALATKTALSPGTTYAGAERFRRSFIASPFQWRGGTVKESGSRKRIFKEAGDRRDVSALRGTRKLLRFADEVENHGSIFFAFAPGRSLGDVIFVLEAKDEVVLVAGLRELQISRALGLADQGRGPRRALVRSSERVKLLSDSRGILRL